ncbi:Clp protease N-terminal domain-containing protein [Parafrankia sp. FMc2]|uniref:Clp protease N-terminal domain-containing protein n=1 Tax=Parafrankia sp. FMc2 TaxID=3233196 RepID=UPI0034D47A9E
MTVIQHAFTQVQQLGGSSVDGVDILLTLAAEASGVRDVLAELGVTPERIRAVLAERVRMRSEQLGYFPEQAGRDRGGVLYLGPSAHEVKGRAEGLAFAWGHQETELEHWLLAVLYADANLVGGLLVDLGTSAEAIVAELRRRGARVPEAGAPQHHPWRGQHHIDVVGLVEPFLALLRERHPPGSEWRWAFNYFPGDVENTRCRVHAEEGIDLHELLAEVKQGGAS